MRMKRLLSILTAMVMSLVTFSGLAVSAGADYSLEDGVLVWDFAEYSSEVNGSTGTQTEYSGLTIGIANNASEKDHDKITTAGIYWRGAPSSGETTRYIAYTPEEDGTLLATGKLNASGGRWGISTTLDVASLAKEHSVTSTSTETVSMKCSAGTTYYIFAKAKSASITGITYRTVHAPIITTVSLNNIYGDHMLLQRDEPIYLEGTASNAQSAVITLQNETDPTDFQVTEITGLSDGEPWNVEFAPVSNYTDTYSITVQPTGISEECIVKTQEIKNILFGDLYLCGGQSNMWYYLKRYYDAGLDYSEEEIANCADSNIRILQLPTPDENKNVINRSTPQNSLTLDAQWRELDSDFALRQYLPATVYSLAKKLHEETDVPIGILSTAVGGTYISQWRENTGSDSYNKSKNWYNTRIYPFRHMKISGVFWYQGCNDRNNGVDYYTKAMTGLIKEYRYLFGDSQLPFYYVQLTRNANVYPDTVSNQGDDTSGMKDVRQAQTDVYLNMQDKTNLGLVSTLDIYGEKEYIPGKNSNFSARVNYHTAQKPVIAERLADLALYDIYGKQQHKDGTKVYRNGPLYKSHTRDGNQLIVEFECNGNLKIMEEEQYSDNHSRAIWEQKGIDTSKPQEFEIAGEDEVYYSAEAELQGNKVILTSENVSEPVSVRYAYAPYPECPNLTDESNLPACAFTAENLCYPSWKFDFGTDEPEDGSIKVDKDCEYKDEIGYGFLGISEKSADYMKVVDGYYQTADTLTTLRNSGDYVYSLDKNRPVRFALKVMPNTYYRVKVTMGNADVDSNVTLTSERRHFVLTGEKIKAGDTLTKEFTVGVHDVKWKNRDSGKPVPTEYEDDLLNIGVIGEHALLNTIEIQQIPKPKTMWIFGDSTVCDTYTAVPYNGFDTAAGWGQAAAKYVPEDVAVVNLAEGGLNTAETSYFAMGAEDITAGDIILLQMGHNEDSVSEYTANLEYYYNTAKRQGAELVLCSPIERLTAQQQTLPWPHTVLHTDYTPAARKYAEEKNIPYVDLNQLTYDFNNKIGRIPSWYFHSAYWTGTAQQPVAVNDPTHMNDYGADNTCHMLMTALKQLAATYPVLAGYGKETFPQAIMSSEELMKNGTAEYVMPPLNEQEEYFPKPKGDADFEYEVELYDAVVEKGVDESKTLSQITVKRNITLSYITVIAAVYDTDGRMIKTEQKRLEPAFAGSSEVVSFDKLRIEDGQKAKVFVWNGAFQDGTMNMNALSDVYPI